MKTSEFRCINKVETKSQRTATCLAYLGTVIHKNRVIITCRKCKAKYAIVGDNLEIKRIVDTDIRLALKVEVINGRKSNSG